MKRLVGLTLVVVAAATVAVRAGWLRLLLSRNYSPHLACYRASPGLVWTNVATDGLIAVSYVTIFVSLLTVAHKLRRHPQLRGFIWIFVAFGAFILTCAMTHLMEIVTVWLPFYPLSAALKAVCAGVSIPTAVLFLKVAPSIDVNVCQFFDLLAKAQKGEQDAVINYREQIEAIDRTQMMIEFNMDGSIIRANDNYVRAFGYSQAELSGKEHSFLVTDEYRNSSAYAEFWVALRSGVFQSGIFKRVDKGGNSVWIHASYNPVLGADGRPFKVVKFGLDVTDRMRTQSQLQDAESRLTAILDSVADGILSIDARGTVVSFNPAAAKMFGYEASEVIERNIKMLMPEPYHGEHDGYLSRYAATGEARIIGTRGREVTGRRKDGSVFPMDLTVSAFAIREQKHYSGIVRDISARKEAELDRERTLAELYERSQALERRNQELDAFAFAASHDLKAPLRVIHNASTWIEEDLEQHLTAESRETLTLLRSRVKRMDRLLDDLLQYARIGREAVSADAEVISGVDLIDNVVGLLAIPEGFIVDVGSGFSGIEVLRMPLQQILMNLISNSIKHHDRKSGVVQVSVEDQGAKFLFRVVDDGPGIAAQYHEQIFKMFQTLKPRDQVEGSGLGLAMVRKHIDVAGCEIYLDSEEGRGSTFSFTWPKAREQARRASWSTANFGGTV